MLKLIEIEPILEILNPILNSKCKGLFAYELIKLIDELEKQLEKVNKVRQKMVEDYGIKDQVGKLKVTKIPVEGAEDREIYDFGENAEKVEEELQAVFNTDYEIDNPVDFKHFTDIEIEPIKLKVLLERNIIK